MSYFDTSEKTMRTKRSNSMLFERTDNGTLQTSLQTPYRQSTRIDMKYQKELCEETWRERYNCVMFNTLKQNMTVNLVFLISLKHYTEHYRETKL